jgi:hypothetical protein
LILERVISGGQTGVDRAGLDAALRFGIAIGGAAPPDLWAEDGRVPAFYRLEPVDAPSLEQGIAARTIANVEVADATLIIRSAAPSAGTDLTISTARRLGKPIEIVFLESSSALADVKREGARIADWVASLQGSVLNVAGPRESTARLFGHARECLSYAFRALKERGLLREADCGREPTSRD